MPEFGPSKNGTYIFREMAYSRVEAEKVKGEPFTEKVKGYSCTRSDN